ncbi:MAG: undecaprenyl-phosphate glucose phosphotransferase [Beijerinckiaceae bacterium]
MAAFTAEDLRAAGDYAPSPASRSGSAAERVRLNALAETLARHPTRRAFSPIVLTGLTRMVEAVLIAASGVLVHAFYVAPAWGYEPIYYIAIFGMTVLSLLVFEALDINHIGAFRAPLRQGFRLAGGWTLVFLAALAAIFFLKLEGMFSRVWLLTWFAVGLTALLLERGIVSIIVHHLTNIGSLDRRTVIVGGGPSAEQVLNELMVQKRTDLRICGFFDDRTDDRSPDVICGFPKLGTVDDLVEFARHTRLDLVIFTLPITAEQRLLQMLRKLWVLPIDIRLAAHTNKLRFRPRSYSYIGDVPVLDVFDKPIADWDVVLKICFDKFFGTIALILLSPIMLATALAVKLDSSGSVLFKQRRYGFNNELIEIYKFRSMYADQLDPGARKLVTRDDPRVTRVGRFIRKTSLDELPQLFNVVFKGNLSLVGPRPHAMTARAADHLYDEVVDGYFARHRVRPGITGWAQIHGWRGETDTQEKIQRRVEHDLYYIENWSILLDLYIIAVTPFALAKSENAY